MGVTKALQAGGPRGGGYFLSTSISMKIKISVSAITNKQYYSIINNLDIGMCMMPTRDLTLFIYYIII